MKKMVAEADDTEPSSKSEILKSGNYSLNSTRTAINQYLLDLREELEKNKYILTEPNHFRLIGNVKIGFSISSDGIFFNIRITESSGDQFLDRSALSAVSGTSGKTKRPKNTGAKNIQTSAVIKYQYGL